LHIHSFPTRRSSDLDDFTWRSNLTLNLGLRYEFQTNPTEVAGRFANLDEPTNPALRVGNPLMANNPSTKSFGPRIGVAWDPQGKDRKSTRLNSSHGS